MVKTAVLKELTNIQIGEVRFAVSHFGKTLLWGSADIYGLYVITQFAQQDAVTAGYLFFLLLAWSALCDIIVGHCIDTHLDARTTTIAMRVAGPITALAFVAAFMPAGPIVGPAVVISASLLFRTTFSLMDVPHNGLLRQLAMSEQARARLAAIRLVAGSLSSFAIGFAAIIFLSGNNKADYFVFAAVIAGVATATFLASPSVTSPPLTQKSANSSGSWLIATMIGIIATSMLLKSLPYIEAATADSTDWAGRAVIAITLGKLLFTPFWYVLVRYCGVSRSSQIAYVLYAATAACLIEMSSNMLAVEIALVMIGASVGGASILSWAMAAEMVDALEAKQGQRLQARIFGLFTCLSKGAVGLGGLSLAFAMTIASAKGSVDLGSPDLGQNAQSLMTLVCSILFICSVMAAMLLQGSLLKPAAKSENPPQ
jgi:glycoside/pentoside/hexuronide:cation symporter, GPH family